MGKPFCKECRYFWYSSRGNHLCKSNPEKCVSFLGRYEEHDWCETKNRDNDCLEWAPSVYYWIRRLFRGR